MEMDDWRDEGWRWMIGEEMRDILLGTLASQATAEEEARGFPADVDGRIGHLVIGSTEMKRARLMISPFLRSGKSCRYS